MKYILLFVLTLVLLYLLYRHLYVETFIDSSTLMAKINATVTGLDADTKNKINSMLNNKLVKLKENLAKIDKLNLNNIGNTLKTMDYATFSNEAKKIDPELFNTVSVDLYSNVIAEANKVNSNINDSIKKIYSKEYIKALLTNNILLNKNDADTISNIVSSEVNK